MSLDIVAHIENWIRQGCPEIPGRREWGEALYMAQMKKSMRQFAPAEEKARHNDARPTLSASSFKSCMRQVYYKANGAPEDERPAPRLPFVFATGDFYGAVLAATCVWSGLPVVAPGPDGLEPDLEFDTGHGVIPGHADILMDYPGHGVVPVECKGLNGFTFDDWLHGPRAGGGGRNKAKAGPNNDWGYLAQIHTYMASSGTVRLYRDGEYVTEEWHSTGRGFFLAINKLQQSIACWEVERDDKLLGWIREAHRVATTNTMPPPRPHWATMKHMPIAKCEELEAVACGYCDFKSTCWPGIEQTIVGGRPKYRRPVTA